MNYSDFTYWINTSEKKGKFVAFKDLPEVKYEEIISMMPAIGTSEHLMVPLGCIDSSDKAWLATIDSYVVDIIDVDWLKEYPVLKACNLRSL